MAKRLMVIGLVVALGLITINSEASLQPIEENCPRAANISGKEVIADYNQLGNEFTAIRNELFKKLGINPNTPVAELNNLGKEIKPILDILDNPAKFRELVGENEVTITREFEVFDAETAVCREFINLGDLTIRISRSKDVSSIQITKDASTVGIRFDVPSFCYSSGKLATGSVVYNEKGPISLYLNGSTKPVSNFEDWELDGNMWFTDEGELHYPCE